MTSPDSNGISFITFTYNDHDFVRGLLTYVHNLGIPLRNILVVDDASSEPFTSDLCPEKTSILRPPQNLGAPLAKKTGYDTIEGNIIFSLDADMRPHQKWLLSSLPLLAEPSVGLVSASCSHNRLSGYLGAALFATSPSDRTIKEVPFAGGGCWLFRKDVWDAVGGLNDMPEQAFEDIFFCQKLRSLGYRIIFNDQYPVYETRNLHRVTFANRRVRYFSPSISSIINEYGLKKYVDDSEKLLIVPIQYFATSANPILCYAFLLELNLLFHTMTTQKLIQSNQPEMRLALLEKLAAYPKTQKLLEEDLRKGGVSGALPTLPEGFTKHIELCEKAGVLQALENIWVERYRQEDVSGQFHQHYLEESS